VYEVDTQILCLWCLKLSVPLNVTMRPGSVRKAYFWGRQLCLDRGLEWRQRY